MKALSLAIACLALSGAPALAQTSHSGTGHSSMGHSSTGHSSMGHSSMKMDHKSMGDRAVNVSHDAIPEIGWPAMTMDMILTEDAQVMGDMAPGASVVLMLIKGGDGMYQINAIMPR
jgi:Cu/Ag efflux protein CusF